MKHSALVAEAIIVGDKRKFPAVLIAPYFPLLEDWARNHQIAFSSRAQLIQHPDVQALYDSIVQEINQNLARFEKLKRAILLPDEFTPQDGMLTHSMKVRRRAVEERYRQLIDEVYAHAEAAPVVGHVTGD